MLGALAVTSIGAFAFHSRLLALLNRPRPAGHRHLLTLGVAEHPAPHLQEAFLDACAQRAQADANITTIVALTRAMRPGDITRNRADVAAREVSRLLAEGGEAAPTLRIATVPS